MNRPATNSTATYYWLLDESCPTTTQPDATHYYTAVNIHPKSAAATCVRKSPIPQHNKEQTSLVVLVVVVVDVVVN